MLEGYLTGKEDGQRRLIVRSRETTSSSSNASISPCCQESDQVNRYLKKIEKDDGYLTSALYLSHLMEEKVKQNNAVEIYTDYFVTEDEATNWEQVVRCSVMYNDSLS